MNDYKDTAFKASQMLLKFASFIHANKGATASLGITEKEVFEMANALTDDVRALYKNEE